MYIYWTAGPIVFAFQTLSVFQKIKSCYGLHRNYTEHKLKEQTLCLQLFPYMQCNCELLAGYIQGEV